MHREEVVRNALGGAINCHSGSRHGQRPIRDLIGSLVSTFCASSGRVSAGLFDRAARHGSMVDCLFSLGFVCFCVRRVRCRTYRGVAVVPSGDRSDGVPLALALLGPSSRFRLFLHTHREVGVDVVKSDSASPRITPPDRPSPPASSEHCRESGLD
jgi:hypothetical protein